jgi:hypothetical protein
MAVSETWLSAQVSSAVVFGFRESGVDGSTL